MPSAPEQVGHQRNVPAWPVGDDPGAGHRPPRAPHLHGGAGGGQRDGEVEGVLGVPGEEDHGRAGP